MAISKIILNGITQMDLTSDTVAAANLIAPNTAHGADGEPVVGTASAGGGGTITIEEIPNATGTTLQITTNGSGGGGGSTPSATQHTIHLEFSDETDADIDVYYDDALIGTMITNYTPNPWTYNNKTVYYASLDNVEWLDNSATWETLFDGTIDWYGEDPLPEGDYPYCWIPSLGDVPTPVGSLWRITFEGVSYVLTAQQSGASSGFTGSGIGNPKYVHGTDNGSDAPFFIGSYNNYGAWSGGTEREWLGGHTSIKVERATAS